MGLVLGKKDTRRIKLKIEQVGDYDQTTKVDLDVEYKIMPNNDWQAMLEGDSKIAEVLTEAIVDVKGLSDEVGNALTFNDELKEALLNETWLIGQLWEGFLIIQAGKKQSDVYKAAKQKN